VVEHQPWMILPDHRIPAMAQTHDFAAI
jgi:hypothetical protein